MYNKEIISKAMLFISLKHDVSPAEFESFFANAMLNPEPQGKGITDVKNVLMDASEISDLPHQRLMADSPAPYSAVYQLKSAGSETLPDLSEEISNAVKQLDEWIDVHTSTIFVGTEVPITLGSGPIELIMPLRRRDDVSHKEFMQNWYERHTSIGEAVEGVRYRQNHLLADLTASACDIAGISCEPFDGITESFFLNAENAISVMGQPHVANEAIADEKLFIDHSQSRFGFYRIL